MRSIECTLNFNGGKTVIIIFPPSIGYRAFLQRNALDVSFLTSYTSHLLNTYDVYFAHRGSTPDYSYDYDYDESGNATTVVVEQCSSSDLNYSYSYDSLNQLESETKKTGGTTERATTYNYDNRGNIISKATTASGTTTNAAYAYGIKNGLEVLTKYSKTGGETRTVSYTYDNAGNPITIKDEKSGTTTNYTLGWTQGKKLQSYSGGSVNNRYYYNESGLVSKLVKADGITVEYYYDDGLLEYEEYRNSSGTLTRIHKYFYDSDGTLRFLLTKTKDFTNSNNFNLYAYIYDGTGTITDLMRLRVEGSSSATVSRFHAAHYEYDAYGKILVSTNKGGSENIASLNPFKYKAYYYDSELSMYRLETRFYDPEIGRFLNADDLSLLQETPSSLGDKNLYAYCDNNPVMRKDSNGEFWHVAIGAIVSAGYEVAAQMAEHGKVTNGWAVLGSAVVGAVSSSLGPISGLLVSAVGTFGVEYGIKKSNLKESFSAAGLNFVCGKAGSYLGNGLETGFKSVRKNRTLLQKAFSPAKKEKSFLNPKKWVKINSRAKVRYRTRSYYSNNISGLSEFTISSVYNSRSSNIYSQGRRNPR